MKTPVIITFFDSDNNVAGTFNGYKMPDGTFDFVTDRVIKANKAYTYKVDET